MLRRRLPVWILLAVCVGAGAACDRLWPRPYHGHGIGPRTLAKVNITTIEGALYEYSMSHGGEFPVSLEALIEPDVQGYRYLNSSRVPLDPWHRAYLYTPPCPTTPRPVVTSLGRDGVVGGEGEDEDVSSATITEALRAEPSPR